MGKGEKAIERIRLDHAEIESLLNEMDASEQSTASDKRRHSRFKYHRHRCLIKIVDASRVGARFYLVSYRNLSVQGICCLHAGFIYPDTKCFIELLRITGEHDRHAGIVRRCSYVGNGLHEVGVEFDNAIAVEKYVEDHGTLRVLVVDDDPDMRRLAVHYLSAMGLESTEVTNGEEAVRTVESGNFDLILTDLDMPVMNGFEAISRLRRNGYAGKIAAVTGMTEPSAKERCLLAGADAVLGKPILRKNLEDLFELLSGKATLSEFNGEPSMRQRIRKFVGRLPELIREVEETFAIADNGDYAALESLCQLVRKSAAAHGFPYLSSAAGDLQSALSFRLEKSAVTEAVRDLVHECNKIWIFGRKSAIVKSLSGDSKRKNAENCTVRVEQKVNA